MNAAIRNIQLVAVVVVLISTIVAFLLEIVKMYEVQNVTLADLLLMFIYIEVIGLVRSYWESRAVRVIYPLVIAITALARYIILQDKESDPTNLIYLASEILIISIATVVIRFRRSKYLNIDKDKSNDL
jgi:protein PsiE